MKSRNFVVHMNRKSPSKKRQTRRIIFWLKPQGVTTRTKKQGFATPPDLRPVTELLSPIVDQRRHRAPIVLELVQVRLPLTIRNASTVRSTTVDWRIPLAHPLALLAPPTPTAPSVRPHSWL